MGIAARLSSMRLLSAAAAVFLLSISSVNPCQAQTSELTAALRQKAGVEDMHGGDSDSLRSVVRPSYRRQLTRAEFEEIKITKGHYDGDNLNSDDFKIVFKVGEGIGEEIRCLVVRSPEEVVANIVPCKSPIRLKDQLTADGMYGVGIFGTVLSTGETIEVTSIWHMDRVPPNTLLSAEAQDTGDNNIRFTFRGFDENDHEEHGPLTFQCSLDGEKWTACTSPRTVSVTTPGAHEFRVRAVDKAGNVDPYPDVYEWDSAGVPTSELDVLPSPSPSPSPTERSSPSPSPSSVPSPSPSPSIASDTGSVSAPSTSEVTSGQNPTVTTLNSDDASAISDDGTRVSNSESGGGSSSSDRRVTNEIIAAVVVIPVIIIVIGGFLILKKQTEQRQQLEEENMANNAVIKTIETPFPDPNYEDSERSISERSLSEKSMPE